MDVGSLLAIPVVPRIIVVVVVPVVVIPRVVVPTIVPRRTPRVVPSPRIVPRIVPTVVTVVSITVITIGVVPGIIPRVVPIGVVVLVVEAVALHKHDGYGRKGIIPSRIVVIAIIAKTPHGAIKTAEAVAVRIIVKDVFVFVVAAATVDIIVAALYRFITKILNRRRFGFILTAIINVIVVIVRLCLKAQAKATEGED